LRQALNRARVHTDDLAITVPIRGRDELSQLASHIRSLPTTAKQCQDELHQTSTELEQRVLERTTELDWAKRRVEAILNNSPDGILLAYTDLRIQQTNTAFDKLLTCETDDYFNQSLLVLIRAEDRDRVAAIIQRAISERADKHIDMQVRRKDSTHFDAELRIGYIHELNEELDGLVCTIRDISKRKQDEQALKAKMDEEREFQQYLKALHEITIALTQIDSLDDFYKRAVEFGLQRLGFERMALFLYDPAQNLAYGTYGTDPQGQLISEATSRFTPMPNGIMMRAFRQAERLCIDEPTELYDGGHRPVGMGWNAAAVLWNGTESLGWLVADNLLSQKPATKPLMEILSLYGLTLGTLLAHKQAAAALIESEYRLRESEWMLQNVLETIPVRVFWKDRNLAFLGANRLYLQDVGLNSAEEIIGKNELEMPWSEQVSDYITEDQVVFSSGIPLVNHEVSVTLEDGQRLWFQTNKVPLRDNLGAIIGILAAYTDITERKQVEEVLQQALESEKELSELKSRFVSMASHEFRTPLTSILSSAEILSRYREKMTGDQITAKLDLISRQVKHLTNIIDDILNLGRIQSGRIEFHPVDVDLDELCCEVIADFQNRPDIPHQIHYSCEQSPLIFPLDRTLIRQVITNLLSNAIKYSPQGKNVWVTLDSTKLSVRDEGIGIPEADLSRLFQPFHRSNNVGAISGTGLGLAITKEAIERHGGTIGLQSVVGAGTTFTINFHWKFENAPI
jgi:PAS domain S-box-containing protein